MQHYAVPVTTWSDGRCNCVGTGRYHTYLLQRLCDCRSTWKISLGGHKSGCRRHHIGCACRWSGSSREFWDEISRPRLRKLSYNPEQGQHNEQFYGYPDPIAPGSWSWRGRRFSCSLLCDGVYDRSRGDSLSLITYHEEPSTRRLVQKRICTGDGKCRHYRGARFAHGAWKRNHYQDFRKPQTRY